MRKTININRVHLIYLVVSLFLGFITLFVFEHFGNFSFLADNTNSYNPKSDKMVFSEPMSNDANVNTIYYNTFFGKKITTNGNGFLAKDIGYKNGDFHTYSNKLYYLVEALKIDYKYGLLFSLSIFCLLFFFNSYKIKLT